MKKIFFIIAAMALASMQLHAQLNLDTVTEKFHNYHYNWYDSVWNVPTTNGGDSILYFTGSISAMIGIKDTFPGQDNPTGSCSKGVFAETAVAYVPDSVMRLVGVAFGGIDSTNPVQMLSCDENYNSWMLPERLRGIAVYHVNIYDKNMNLLQSVSVPYTDGLQPARYIPVGVHHYADCQYTVTYSLIKHVYLNTPMDMTDTFYISRVITYNDTVWRYNDICGRGETHCYIKVDSFPINPFPFLLPWENYKFRNPTSLGDTVPWRDDYTFGWQHALMYPIVEHPGDSCPQVRGVTVQRAGAAEVFLNWQGGTNHHDWQLAYGPAGTPPEECTILSYKRTMSEVFAVDPDSQYVAYVRARCRLARDEWGPWSDPVTIWVNAPQDGIEDLDNPELKVEIVPNPASGEVRVVSSARVTKVELMDVAGMVLRTFDTATIDVSGIPTGTYMVRIHTPMGVATKRLAVAR